MITGGNRYAAGLVLLGLALFVAGCGKPKETYRLSGVVAASGYRVSLVGNFDEAHLQLLEEGIADRLARVGELMSADQQGNELSLLNRLPSGVPVLLSEPVAAVLRTALIVARSAHDNLDIIEDHSPHFDPGHDFDKITADAVGMNRSAPLINDRALTLYGNALVKYAPVNVDLAPIARGYAVDRVADYLNDHNVDAYLVEVGGQIRSRGYKPGGAPWRVAVEHDSEDDAQNKRASAALGEAALVTTWADRDRFDADNRHGSPPSSSPMGTSVDRPAAVTVVADRCAVAAAWAAMLGKLDVKMGLEVAERESIAAYFVVQVASGLKITYSSSFAPYLGQTGEGERS